MPQLQNRLDRLMLRLDRMGMRCQQAVLDALAAAEGRDAIAGSLVDEQDAEIDREEVDIEQECIRLLALYQPAAIDLRTLCFVIKVNNDLERIADKAASIGRRVKHVAAERIDLAQYPGWTDLVREVTDRLDKTLRAIATRNLDAARAVIASDPNVDAAYGRFVRTALTKERSDLAGVDVVLTLTLLARALERIGDLCTNIAEDVVFLCTGDIVRHAQAREDAKI
ncbi:MAG: phosphate signaling complex protein PhoU [Planctomycetota bacterium]|nr:phosphate signaling complex protein PhoU [Planctomycetota bacterium]